MLTLHLRSSLPRTNTLTILSVKTSSSWRLTWTDSTPIRQVEYCFVVSISLIVIILEPSVHHIPLDIHGFPDNPSYGMESDYRIPPKKKIKRKHNKPLYRPPPVLREYTPPFSSKESQEPEYRHQYPEETVSDFQVDKVHQK